MRSLISFLGVIVAVAGGIFLPLATFAAVAVGVNPASLTVEINTQQQTTVSLQVFNEGSEEAIFDVYADDLSDWFVISPVQFRLSPSQQQLVKIKITALQPGRRQVFLSVTGRALRRQSFNAAAGVKVPVNIVAKGGAPFLARGEKWAMAGLIILAILLLVVIGVYYHYHRRSWWRRTRDRFDLLVHHRRPFYYRLLKYLKRW